MQVQTRIRSSAMRVLSSERYLDFLRARARLARRVRGAAPAVHYFHEVDDPYSHLAVQKLDQLRDAYPVTFRPHLVSKPGAEYQGSSRHFDHWALRDALSVAADYGTTFPPRDPAAPAPSAERLAAANDALAPHLTTPDFARVATATGEAFWSGTQPPGGTTGQGPGRRAIAEGNALRQRLGHYLGGMFHFDGEWFWGIDRIRSLEQRLRAEGYGDDSAALCVPEPKPANSAGLAAGHVVLEYFPSLRSPYTAIGHPRVLDLIARSGVTVAVRPVMPMLMRGVPAPRSKQRYIIVDAGREARFHGVPFGRIVDPFGEPVKRAFALFPGAVALGKGMEFVTAYLSAAWAEGVDITSDDGLRHVAARAALDWTELLEACEGTDWHSVLDDNLQRMLAAGLWGVPSFRVSGGRAAADDAPAYACWGQDRIWRVANEIARRA
ncbi:MAG: DsbA family protein [Pseudomonadales bacterium]